MKYKILKEHMTVLDGVKMYRIQALKDFSDVKKGDVGGIVESERNLSQNGDCWIYDSARVYGSARVFEDAQIFDVCKIYDDARVFGSAKIYGSTRVFEDAQISGSAKVFA